MLIWPLGHSCQMPGQFIYLFIYFLIGGSSAVRSMCAEPFVLWSNKEGYWFIGDRQLPFASSSSPLFRFTVWSPGKKSLVTEAERSALCYSSTHVYIDTETDMPVKIQGKMYRLTFIWGGVGGVFLLTWSFIVMCKCARQFSESDKWQNRPASYLRLWIMWFLKLSEPTIV